jgi:hypothetical protein
MKKNYSATLPLQLIHKYRYCISYTLGFLPTGMAMIQLKLENTCMQKPSPSDKTNVFFEHEVFKVAVMVCNTIFF